MSDQVFISHSRDDENLLNELDKVFGKVGLKQYRASFEDQAPPVSQELKNQINDSEAMLVVLGKRAQAKTHTMIWIGWEAGIAIQSGIPVWILEDVQSQVKEPIPSFTDFILWDSSDDDQKRILRDILEEEFILGTGANVSTFSKLHKNTSDSPFGNQNRRNSARVNNSKVTEAFRGVRCPHSGCGEEYIIRFEGPDQFNCPSCRQRVMFSAEDQGVFSY